MFVFCRSICLPLCSNSHSSPPLLRFPSSFSESPRDSGCMLVAYSREDVRWLLSSVWYCSRHFPKICVLHKFMEQMYCSFPLHLGCIHGCLRSLWLPVIIKGKDHQHNHKRYDLTTKTLVKIRLNFSAVCCFSFTQTVVYKKQSSGSMRKSGRCKGIWQYLVVIWGARLPCSCFHQEPNPSPWRM